MAIKAVAVDDQNTQHLIIGLNRDNINSLLDGDVFTLPGGVAIAITEISFSWLPRPTKTLRNAFTRSSGQFKRSLCVAIAPHFPVRWRKTGDEARLHNPKSPDDILALLKKVRAELDLDPNAPSGPSAAANSLRRTLSSLGQIVIGVSEIRNLYGTGHGRTGSHELGKAHARLVVNAATSVATFLVEVWEARSERAH